MDNLVVALFDNRVAANAAVQDLIDAGFSSEAISVVSPGEADGRLDAEGGASGALIGAGTGALLGGLLAVIGLPVPGIGPVLAARPLAAALIGAGVGAAAGGVIGALVDIGVPEGDAAIYAEGVRRGGTLVLVHAVDPMRERAIEVLGRHGPVDVEERVASWREAGWTAVDHERAGFPTEDLMGDRRRRAAAGDRAARGARVYGRPLGARGGGDLVARARRFGAEFACNPRYGSADWGTCEPEMRRQWQEREGATWESVRDDVRLAWEHARQRRVA